MGSPNLDVHWRQAGDPQALKLKIEVGSSGNWEYGTAFMVSNELAVHCGAQQARGCASG